MIESYLNLFYATNELESIMKLTKDSRRFMLIYSDICALLEHPNYQRFGGDTAEYFNFLHHLLDDEKTVRTFANLLYHWPVNGFEYKTRIMTALMAQQVKKQLAPLDAFWYDFCKSGVNYIEDPKLRPNVKSFEPVVTSEQFWDYFQLYCAQRKVTNPYSTNSAFINQLLLILPKEVKPETVRGSNYIFTFPVINPNTRDPTKPFNQMQFCLDYLYSKNDALRIDDENKGDVDNIKRKRMTELKPYNIMTQLVWPNYGNLQETNGPVVPEFFTEEDEEQYAFMNDEFDKYKEAFGFF